MTSLGSTPTASKFKLDFVYDYSGRRLQKLVSTNSGAGYVAQYTNRFAYDGWNLVDELNPDNTVIRSYIWGLDLSGTQRGAGGVGGLLDITAPGASQFVCFDGNGNVTALVDSSSSVVTGQYEYGPFGELIRLSGSVAQANLFRLSSKYLDSESDILHYPRRDYSSSLGRWITRDPLTEMGGLNLNAAMANDVVGHFDPFGMEIIAGTYIPTDNARQMFLGIGDKTAQSYVAREMGLGHALLSLLSILDRVTLSEPYGGTMPSGASAYTVGSSIYVHRDWDPADLAHEFVHAYNHEKNAEIEADLLRDEGTAYAFGTLWSAAVIYWPAAEHSIASDPCNWDKVRSIWQYFWQSAGPATNFRKAGYNDPANFGGHYNGPANTSFDFILDARNYRDVRQMFGLHLSCQEIANVINTRYLNGCCFRVTCDAEARAHSEIPAGVKIHPSFK
jgi:RHS repeat-associated protein